MTRADPGEKEHVFKKSRVKNKIEDTRTKIKESIFFYYTGFPLSKRESVCTAFRFYQI